MPAMIESLRRDHRNFEELLGILEQEVALFEQGERPDYEIIEAVVRYFETYPERCHHPKEDLVFEKLRQRDPAAAQAVGDLEAEHVELTGRLRGFATILEGVVGERELPREVFDRTAREFVEHERLHMKKEEDAFFAAALQALTREDWAELDSKLSDETDPLFGGRPERRFAALHRRIVEWEREDQAARASAERGASGRE